MKALNLATLVLTILAGLDVGLVGVANTDVISMVFGVATPISRAIEVILGLAAVYQIYPLVRAWSLGEIPAEASRV